MAGMETEKVDLAPAAAPLLFTEAAGAAYIGAGNFYLQNAPQVNQLIKGAVEGPPGASSSPYENAGFLIRHGYDELNNGR